MKHSVIERKVIPYFNIFADSTSICFMMMSMLYFLGYILGGFYVEVARMLGKESASTSSSTVQKPKEEPVYRAMRQIQSEFIGRLPGFLMAFVCATVGKVAMQVRVSLCILYTGAMGTWMFASIFGANSIAELASTMGHVCCLKLFFYSYIPLYGLFAGMMSDYFAMAVGQWQGLVRKLLH